LQAVAEAVQELVELVLEPLVELLHLTQAVAEAALLETALILLAQRLQEQAALAVAEVVALVVTVEPQVAQAA
jgi:hypothetical protein